MRFMDSRGTFNRFRGMQAFTLAEILVAVTIIALVLTTVLATFTGVLSSAREAEKKAELYQTGRTVMDILCADLRGFKPVSRPEGGFFFVGDQEIVDGGPEMSKVDFITTHSLSMGIKGIPYLSEVGYRVKRNPQGGLYSLWRRSQQPPQDPYIEGGNEIPICRILESFRLDFLTQDDRSDNLLYIAPVAVTVSFTLNLDGEREHFVTMVRPMVEQ